MADAREPFWLFSAIFYVESFLTMQFFKISYFLNIMLRVCMHVKG